MFPDRRTVLNAALAVPAAAIAAAAPVAAARAQGGTAPSAGPELDAAAWSGFAQRMVTADGRVTDTGNKGISHSEGQGYGLLLAVAARDRAVFDRIRSWTRANLLTRPDGLLAWKWELGKGVTDANNATDGDILYAWGLLRAGEVWPDAGGREEALPLLQAVRARAVVRVAGRTVLLPGVDGFRRGDSVVFNPSYIIFPALRAFAAADPSGPWEDAIGAGLALLAKARFGKWQLPPDWAMLGPDGAVTLPDGFRRQFGYDAIRVPLYLAWGGYRDPWYFRPYAAFVAGFGGGPVPATVSLPGGTTAQVPASVGMLAVHRLAVRLSGTQTTVTVPPAAANEDYYSTVLGLLVRLAERSLGLAP